MPLCDHPLRLPLYEGVDWNITVSWQLAAWKSLPLYEGVDWNPERTSDSAAGQVSLFTREWIEIASVGLQPCRMMNVSLFTREWIEIIAPIRWHWPLITSPSLRGSGLKYYTFVGDLHEIGCLPLYEGVDWNCIDCSGRSIVCVSLFTREWIEIRLPCS